jgi:ABC-type transport system involved in multi-copper enzyme maturation permease subunit
MSSLAEWLRRKLPSGSREAWLERAAASAVLGAAVVLLLFWRHLPLSRQIVLWAAVLLAAAFVTRRGWLKLFGPVLFYDLVRIARRNRYFLVRVLYAGMLLVMLCWVYFAWTIHDPAGSAVSANEAAEFASTFFYMFMAVQFLVVTVVTPAYTAGAIAEEKELKTLEFLLATDLRNREIVLSKLVSRLLNLVLLVLTGLPVLAGLQFLGGVDPGLVIAGFAATGLTVASLAGLSIYNSTMTQRARDAIVLTYLMAGGYLVVSGLSWLLLLPTGWGTFPSTTTWTSPVTVQDLVEGLNAGNIVAAVIRLAMQATTAGGVPMDEMVPALLRNYAIVHGGVAILAPAWSLLRLRAVALQEAGAVAGHTGPASSRNGRSWWAPGLGARAMLWKELFAERRGIGRGHRVGQIVVGLLVVVSFVPAVILVVGFVDGTLEPLSWASYGDDGWDALAENMNVWQVRLAGTLIACLLLLAVAVRASSSISGERDRQTLDSLLMTPLDSDEILSAKWLGAVLSVRRGWLWLGGVWLLGLATGGLHPLALILLALMWFVYAGFLAILGLWFSVTCRTTLRATTWTLVCATAAACGHWLIWLCCVPLFIIGPMETPEVFLWLAKFQAGFTPPIALGYLASFSPLDLRTDYYTAEEAWEWVGFAVLGTGTWAVLATVLWVLTSRRFRAATGRAPLSRVWPGQSPSGPCGAAEGGAASRRQEDTRTVASLLLVPGDSKLQDGQVRSAACAPPPGEPPAKCP